MSVDVRSDAVRPPSEGSSRSRRSVAAAALSVPIAVVVVLALLAPTAGAAVAPTPVPTIALRVSGSPDRSNATPLAGATVGGSVAIFAQVAGRVTGVRFYLDGATQPLRVDPTAPWDLGGTAADGSARLYDTTRLAPGQHTLVATAHYPKQQTVSATAVFTVAGAPGTLRFSTHAERSDPHDLSGASLSRSVAVFADAPGAKHVRFFLDTPTTGKAVQTDNAAPFDLEGARPDGTARMLDTATLAKGSHTARAVIDRKAGPSETIEATFTVGNVPAAIRFSAHADRSDPHDVSGATLTGSVAVFADAPGASRVSFYLDTPTTGTPTQIDAAAPFDLKGTATDGTANLFDTATLTAGSHTVRAVVEHGAAPSETVDATFTTTSGVTAPSAWQQVLHHIGSDGTVDKDTALAAFVLAFGPLPGVPTPPGPLTDRPDGSGPLRWTLGHWAELTPDQQAAVRAWTGGPVASTPAAAASTLRSSAAAAAPPVQCSTEGVGHTANPSVPSEKADLDGIAAARTAISGRIGFDLGFPVTLCENTVEIKPNGLDAVGYTYSFDSSGGYSGPPVGCVITLNPSVRGSDNAPIEATYVHELYHCYQARMAGSAGYTGLASWVVEGSAAWVEADLVPDDESALPYWFEYLGAPPYAGGSTVLFGRSYDAIGFYAHLFPSVGVSPWSAFPAMEHAASNEAAFSVTGADDPAFLNSWASVYFRLPRLGSAWDQGSQGDAIADANVPSKGLVGHVPDIFDVADGGGTSLFAAPYATTSAFFRSTAFVTVVQPEAGMSMRVADVNDPPFESVDPPGALLLCTAPGGVCDCPSGSSGGADAQAFSDLGAIAFTGGTGSATLTVRVKGVSQDDFCNPDPPPPDNGGRGGSTGDPHLRTFDQTFYSFQGAGEFVATKSTTDNLEIQERQQPVGTSTTVSVDTAVAMRVASDRLAFYRSSSVTPDVRLNGVLVGVPDDGLTLPGGGWVTPVSSTNPIAVGFIVVWPDGSQVLVQPMESYGLQFQVILVPTRKRSVEGLLGPWSGDQAHQLIGRDGTDFGSAASFADLNGRFGESWRVTPAESLFDYLPGQSTDTFTDRSIPSAPLSVADLAADEVAAATSTCQNAGVADPVILQDCILDVAVTNQPAFATGAAEAQYVFSQRTFDIKIGATVAADSPSGAGALTAGETDRFRFSGTQGQVVYLKSDPTRCTSGQRWEVVDPTGWFSVAAGRDACDDLGRVTLPTAGVYTVTMASSGHPGSYGFSLSGVPVTVTFPISVGTTVSAGSPRGAGSLVPGAVQRFTFAGVGGESVGLKSPIAGHPASDPACSVQWALESPTGVALTGTGSTKKRFSLCDSPVFAIAVDGTYAVTVVSSGYTGDYGFTLAGAFAFPITIGTTVSAGSPSGAGTLVPGATERFTFAGTAGQKVYLRIADANAFGGAQGACAAQWQLDDPSGTPMPDTSGKTADPLCFDLGRFTLPSTGTYTVVVDADSAGGSYTGDYGFSLTEVPNDYTFPITIGTTVSTGSPPGAGTLAPGAKQVFTFSGTTGQDIYLRPADSIAIFSPADACNAAWQLNDPSGTALPIRNSSTGDTTIPLCLDLGRFTLPTTGTYSIVINTGSTIDSYAGDFGFSLTAVPVPVSFPIAIGTTVASGSPPGAGTLVPGAIQRFTFTGTAGQMVYASSSLFTDPLSIFAPACNAFWELDDPAGNQVPTSTSAGDQSVPLCVDLGFTGLTLPSTGTYTIEVRASDPTANTSYAGPFGFTLSTVPPPQVFPIAIGSSVRTDSPVGAGTLSAKGAVQRFTFTATAGQVVKLVSSPHPAAGTFGCHEPISLVDPTGKTLVPTGSTSTTGTFPLCADPGSYTLPAAGTYAVVVGPGPYVGPFGFDLTAG